MKQKRILYAVIGVALMLFAGFIYAWSIISASIAADFPEWTSAQLSLTFTLCMGFFCLGGMAAGTLSKRIPVRVNVMISAVLFLVGFFLVSRVNSLPILYISYGVLCGTASGFAYNSIMNVMPQWFPDRQGLISGVLLMGFGASSMIIGSVFSAVTPNVTGAWRDTLLYLGILMAACLFAGSFFFNTPKPGELPATKSNVATAVAGPELAPGKMIKTPKFWLFYFWALLVSAAGLVVIAQARSVAVIAAPSLDIGVISFIVGLISICNGLGRVIFGALFDKIGRKRSMVLVMTCYVIGLALLMLCLSGSTVMLVVGFIFIGLGYGGGPTMSAAAVRQFFGRENYPVNFSLMNTNLLPASFASTAAATIYDASGSFMIIFGILFGLIVLSALAWTGIKD